MDVMSLKNYSNEFGKQKGLKVSEQNFFASGSPLKCHEDGEIVEVFNPRAWTVSSKSMDPSKKSF